MVHGDYLNTLVALVRHAAQQMDKVRAKGRLTDRLINQQRLLQQEVDLLVAEYARLDPRGRNLQDEFFHKIRQHQARVQLHLNEIQSRFEDG